MKVSPNSEIITSLPNDTGFNNKKIGEFMNENDENLMKVAN
jgi:hypothetical protein